MSLAIELVEGEGGFRRLSDEWGELLGRCPNARIFCTYEWVRAAHLTRRPAARPFIIKAYAGERLVGLAPLCLVPGLGGLNKIEHMASAGSGFADYLDILCEPGFEPALLEAVFRGRIGSSMAFFAFFELKNSSARLDPSTRVSWALVNRRRDTLGMHGYRRCAG